MSSIQAMKDTAVKYKKAGVPIGGIGVQGHMHGIDVHVIKASIETCYCSGSGNCGFGK